MISSTPASMSAPSLDRRPEARIEPIEDIVRRTREGRIRVPPFQRGLRWGSREVLDLFDSIYRGLPIGSLLVWRKPAPADRIELGPLKIDSLQVADAWWVVDGQQRLTALTVSLTRTLPLPSTPDDPFVVYFDPAERKFHAPEKGKEIPDRWVPLPYLIDATLLSDYVLDWKHRDLRSTLFEAGKRIREYQVPMYIVDTKDESVLRIIFQRINQSGKSLKWSEVHDALYGDSGELPSTVSHLADSLVSVGMGRLDDSELTTCLLALRGLNVTQTLADHQRKDPEVLRGAVAEALPVLRNVLSFLRSHAEIPHLRLLPHVFVVEILTRFFALHPTPTARTLELLVRFVWRTLLAEGTYNDKTLRRQAIAAIFEDEVQSVQKMLELVQKPPSTRFTPPSEFDLRSVGSRLSLLALASLGPRNLADESPIDVAALLEGNGARSLPVLFSTEVSGSRGAANRLLHPRSGRLARLLTDRIRLEGPDDHTIASQGVTREAARALLDGRHTDFLSERSGAIARALDMLGDRLTGWGRRDHDRPSIEQLLELAGEES